MCLSAAESLSAAAAGATTALSAAQLHLVHVNLSRADELPCPSITVAAADETVMLQQSSFPQSPVIDETSL